MIESKEKLNELAQKALLAMQQASEQWKVGKAAELWIVEERHEMSWRGNLTTYQFKTEKEAKDFCALTIMKIVVLAIDGEGVKA